MDLVHGLSSHSLPWGHELMSTAEPSYESASNNQPSVPVASSSKDSLTSGMK